MSDEISNNKQFIKNVLYDGIVYSVYADETAQVTGYSSSPSNVKIPKTISIDNVVYSVTLIKKNAFDYCTSLKSIELPDGLLSIENSAFSRCASLESIIIPSTVTSIGSSAFSDCVSLKSVVLPNTLTSIDAFTFSNCSSLASIVLPPGILEIDIRAFGGCTSLESINIPASVSNIEWWSAFEDCKSLKAITVDPNNSNYLDIDGVLYNKSKTNLILYPQAKEDTSVTIPASVNEIHSLFRGCTFLTSINVDPENTNFSSSEDGILYNKDKSELLKCPEGINKTSIIIPNTVKAIGGYAVSNCKNIEKVSFEEQSLLTDIRDYAFYHSYSLQDIELPNTLTSIHDYAFKGCPSLYSIIIPCNVSHIGSQAFGDDSFEGHPNSLDSIYFLCPYSAISSDLNNISRSGSSKSELKLLYYANGNDADDWKEYSNQSNHEILPFYKVSFENGADIIETQLVKNGSYASFVSFDTLDNKFVSGWNLDDDPYSFSNPVTQDLTLTAKLTDKTEGYKVTLMMDNFNVYWCTLSNGNIALPIDPVLPHKTFIEWNTDAKGDGIKVTSGYTISSNTTLYAIFETEKCKISIPISDRYSISAYDGEILLNGESQNGVDIYTVDYGSQIMFKPEAKDGYTISDASMKIYPQVNYGYSFELCSDPFVYWRVQSDISVFLVATVNPDRLDILPAPSLDDFSEQYPIQYSLPSDVSWEGLDIIMGGPSAFYYDISTRPHISYCSYNGEMGYWVGISIALPDNFQEVKYLSTIASFDMTPDDLVSFLKGITDGKMGDLTFIDANNIVEIDGKKYLTLYYNLEELWENYIKSNYKLTPFAILIDWDGDGSEPMSLYLSDFLVMNWSQENYDPDLVGLMFDVDLFNVKYDSNGGIGTVPTDPGSKYKYSPSEIDHYLGGYFAGSKVKVLSNNGLSNPGYVFDGWNTKSDGTGDNYHPNDHLILGANDSTLYAMWVKSQGGSTGGSGGGVPTTPPDVPDEPTIIPDNNGNVDVVIDDKKADELIHEAVSSGSDSVSIIDTSNVDGKYTEVNISKTDLETISKKIENNNNINSVSIETSEGDIILEKEVLNSILETTNADSISFEIEDAKDKLTDAQKEAVGDRPVYDINITAGNENITSFNGKTITISLPYTLKAGEDPENIVVYYVKEDGSLEKVNCTYKDGKVIFETDHLSKYFIGYEEPDTPVTPDTPDDKKDDNNNTIYYAVAAIVVILIIIALAYYFMKKKQ